MNILERELNIRRRGVKERVEMGPHLLAQIRQRAAQVLVPAVIIAGAPERLLQALSRPPPHRRGGQHGKERTVLGAANLDRSTVLNTNGACPEQGYIHPGSHTHLLGLFMVINTMIQTTKRFTLFSRRDMAGLLYDRIMK